MDQMKGTTDSRGKSGISPFSAAIAVVLYFLAGVLVGRIRKEGSVSLNRIEAFRDWYYANQETTFLNTYWLSVPVDKCPLDTWIYQEVIYETQPDLLIETGTYKGGSAYFFASIFDLLKRGRVLTIDISDAPGRPRHERITYLLGSSTSEAAFQAAKNSIRPGERVMVSLDSDHHMAHVLNELRLYSSLVTVGNYLVVEDTVKDPNYPGAMEAVAEFLKTNSNFVPDRSREKFGFTVFPGGWLKRVR